MAAAMRPPQVPSVEAACSTGVIQAALRHGDIFEAGGSPSQFWDGRST